MGFHGSAAVSKLYITNTTQSVGHSGVKNIATGLLKSADCRGLLVGLQTILMAKEPNGTGKKNDYKNNHMFETSPLIQKRFTMQFVN